MRWGDMRRSENVEDRSGTRPRGGGIGGGGRPAKQRNARRIYVGNAFWGSWRGARGLRGDAHFGRFAQGTGYGRQHRCMGGHVKHLVSLEQEQKGDDRQQKRVEPTRHWPLSIDH